MLKPLRLLIIDDDPNDAFFIVRELKVGGFEVSSEQVASAAELDAALQRQSWDVLTCDWMMPSFGAEEALALLQRRGIDTPIIVVTGEMGEEFAVTAMKAGAHDFVSKHKLGRLVPAVERELQEAERRTERARTQAALLESEERLRLAQHAARIIVWDSNLATGKVEWLDPVHEDLRLLPPGFTANEESFLALVHADDREAVGHAIERAIGEDVDFGIEFRVILGDGSVRWVETRGRALRDATGRAHRLLGVALDITDRKRAEALIERSEQQFRSLIENALDLVAVIDAAGTLRYVSPSHQGALGYSVSELIGRSAFDLIHPDDLGHVRRIFVENSPMPGAAVDLEYRFRRRDGSWAAVEATAKNLLGDAVVAGILVNSRDVSDRKRAEEARHEVEARLRALAEAAFEGIAMSQDGVLVDANGRLAEMLGYAREEIIGMSLMELTAPESRDLVSSMIASRHPGPYECFALRRDGTPIPVEVRARMEDVSGKVVRVTAVRDVSDRRSR